MLLSVVRIEARKEWIPLPSRLIFRGVIFARAVGRLNWRLPSGQFPHVKNVGTEFAPTGGSFHRTFRIEREPESVRSLINVVVLVGVKHLDAAAFEEQFRVNPGRLSGHQFRHAQTGLQCHEQQHSVASSNGKVVPQVMHAWAASIAGFA